MWSRIFQIAVISTFLLIGVSASIAQTGADNGSIFANPDDKDRNPPKSFKETLQKLRIEEEQKEFDKMIARGERVTTLTAELEKTFNQKGRLTNSDKKKVEEVEKLVKKIRSELGGDDDDEDKFLVNSENGSDLGEAVKTLRSRSVDLYDELKKTTRFTISAAAIQTSNAVLNLARFLKLAN